MNFDISNYGKKLKAELISVFGERLLYMGLQGSYLRGEATEQSDIDMMVILDRLTVADMDLYREILDKVGERDRACGFICSCEDMKNWNPLEVCQLGFTTKDIYGKLADFLPEWTREDEVNYVKMSLDNLYHALCHGYIHADREHLKNSLPSFYKSAFFILQNTYYLESGEFVLTKAELAGKLYGKDKAIMAAVLALANGATLDFDTYYAELFSWCQKRKRVDKSSRLCYNRTDKTKIEKEAFL